MSKPTFVFTLFLMFITAASAQNYKDFFGDAACRIDFYFAGNSTTSAAYLHKICYEPHWGGRRNHLSTEANLGEYRFRVVDSLSNKLIYTDGFSTLFYEWQSTPEAKTVNKGFEQSIQFPFPKNPVRVIIDKRVDYHHWSQLASFMVSPNDRLIRHTCVKAPVKRLIYNAEPEKAIDIAIVAEGYTASQQAKFYKDARRLAESLFSHEPFARYKQRINVYAIAAESADTGVSVPQNGKWMQSALSSHYHTFYSDRYLTSPDVFRLHDYAALVPYDALYILANTKTYGGGGIYNFYTLASADSKKAQVQVVVHEFGHSFAGLADEYFYDNDALDSMYDLKSEPWEPNISTLVEFDLKWKKNLPSGLSVPTTVSDSSILKIGVFEGGGYLKKGVYRPYFDCRMRTNTAKAFCPVCERAIEDRILFLTE